MHIQQIFNEHKGRYGSPRIFKTLQKHLNDENLLRGGTKIIDHYSGVSLFDGITTKLKLSRNDCWWVITKGVKIAEGLVIAKRIFKDDEGNTHYSIEPDRDMRLSEYLGKLDELKQFMTKKVL